MRGLIVATNPARELQLQDEQYSTREQRHVPGPGPATARPGRSRVGRDAAASARAPAARCRRISPSAGQEGMPNLPRPALGAAHLGEVRVPRR